MRAPTPSSAFVAIDLGSSTGRVMLGLLVERAGGERRLVVSECARFANVPVSRPEGLGWDIEALWSGVIDGLAAAIRSADAAGALVQGIGVDSWGVDYARITRDGAIRPFVRHHRDVDASVRSRDAAAEYAITGVLDQAINTAHQLRLDEAAEIGAPDDTILLIADTIVYRLTDAVAAERSLASTTALIDRHDDDWSTRLTARVGARLPDLVDAGARAGTVTADVRRRIGATSPIPVWFTTAHDTAAAFSAVAEAGEGEHTAIVSCGSWAVVGVVRARPILTEEARRSGFTQEIGERGETLLVKNLSGMWLLQQAMREWAERDSAEHDSAEHDSAEHDSAEQDSGDAGALPSLLDAAAASVYTGRFDPADPALHAPGALVERLQRACVAGGFGHPASRADLTRAILDSLAFAYGHTLDQLARLTGVLITRVRLVGGGARNELLCALTAQRTGLPVTAGPVEASVRGVLLQLAVASGALPDMPAARRIAVDDVEASERIFLPPAPVSARGAL